MHMVRLFLLLGARSVTSYDSYWISAPFHKDKLPKPAEKAWG